MKRIVIDRSTYQIWSKWIAFSLIVMSLLSWQEQVIPMQALVQTLLAFTFLLYLTSYQGRPTGPINVELESDGQWRFLQEQQLTRQWQIDRNSRITPWLVWVSLTEKLSHEKRICLVFRDAVPETQFRAICRVIRRLNTEFR
ncbi:MAG: protein YgfX [Aestuariibacter sp.]